MKDHPVLVSICVRIQETQKPYELLKTLGRTETSRSGSNDENIDLTVALSVSRLE